MNFITVQNKEKKTLIEDVLMYPLRINQDESGGILVETLRSDWKDIYGRDREFFMQYYSVTPSGMARDENVWHYHPLQEDRFLAIQGSIVVAVADNRLDSKTRGVLNLFYMEAEKNPYLLLIPKKTLHGFMVVSKKSAILLNFPTKLYNPKEEGRIPYEKTLVKFPDGSLFSWNRVRKDFSLQETGI